MLLADIFRRAAIVELAPERYPFVQTRDLLSKLHIGSDQTLRRRVLRCRKQIEKLATNAGDPQPSTDDVIENNQWHGYRLNPDLVRIVAITELTKICAGSNAIGGNRAPPSGGMMSLAGRWRR
jgi:hypothetical protein